MELTINLVLALRVCTVEKKGNNGRETVRGGDGFSKDQHSSHEIAFSYVQIFPFLCTSLDF